MIELILPGEHKAKAGTLEELFKFRHRIAVDEMGWDLPDAQNGLDIDQFDTDETAHFILRGADNEILCVSRLNPMSSPTLMSEVFADYCEPGQLPTDPFILEHSRYLAKRDGLSTREYMHVLGRMLLAIHEYSLITHATHIASLTYMTHYSLAVRLFRARPLGFPKVYTPDGNTYMAFTCAVSEKGIGKTRRYIKLDTPQVTPEMLIGRAPNLALSKINALAES